MADEVENIEFIDCTSLNFGYNIMGLVTISYTVIHTTKEFVTYTSLTAGGQTFKGHITNATLTPIPKADGWFETHVTLIATTD